MKLPSRYQKVKSLDDGGMSDAILCTDTHLDRKIAIKSLKSGQDPKRMLHELAALQSIQSKYVVQVYDVILDADGNLTAIVEEYIPGDDLTRCAKPTNEAELLALIYPIASGIAEIHAHDIVHRDIKRQNMKYDAEDRLRIFDFGLARNPNIDDKTICGVGTPGYMAPELCSATPDGTVRFTKAVDVYAFAVTALTLVKGNVPSDLKCDPPILSDKTDFSKLPFPIADEIAKKLNRCLFEDPLMRPTMDELAELLGRHLLKDRHRALIVTDRGTYWLDASNRTVNIKVGNEGSISIMYDGLRFKVQSVTGAVTINNQNIVVGYVLPGSCVIVIGPPDKLAARKFITVDVSHPEVDL